MCDVLNLFVIKLGTNQTKFLRDAQKASKISG